MQNQQIVQCLKCEKLATRKCFNKLLSDFVNGSEKAMIKTECRFCNYSMIIGKYDGKILEPYAPGITFKIMLEASAN